jgi:hypothetical protein
MKTAQRFSWMLLAGALLIAPMARATTSFTVLPDTVSGLPGDTVGWGFSITNDTDFLVVTSADFTPASSLGTFTDYIAQYNFIVVGPSPESSTVSQTFDANLLTGVGSFAISPGAPTGSMITGQLALTYDLFSVSPNDPSFNPDTDTVSTGNTISSAAGVVVAPEPASFGLVGAALLLYGMVGWRKRST